MDIVNISAYKFVELDNLDELRMDLLNRCNELQIMGTVLLGHEGINLILAGSQESIDGITAYFSDNPHFSDLTYKKSLSDEVPFQRMLVKIKPEIVTMGVPEISPSQNTAKAIKPTELRDWLKEKRDFTLMDVRNDYEYQLGTFETAVDLDITGFREFPHYIDTIDEDLKDKPIVMFCTAGIRCEKAGALMLKKGFKEVYQLEGGILKYFEECGGDYYHGECFVFDDRIAVNPDLTETETTLCDVCQYPVTLSERNMPEYVEGVSCSQCIRN